LGGECRGGGGGEPPGGGAGAPRAGGEEVLPGCAPPCPSASASDQQLRRSSSISIACTASRASSRESRRGKQSATCAITSPNAAVHSCWAIVASTATTSCVVLTNDHDRGGRSHARATPDLHRHANDQDLQLPCQSHKSEFGTTLSSSHSVPANDEPLEYRLLKACSWQEERIMIPLSRKELAAAYSDALTFDNPLTAVI